MGNNASRRLVSFEHSAITSPPHWRKVGGRRQREYRRLGGESELTSQEWDREGLKSWRPGDRLSKGGVGLLRGARDLRSRGGGGHQKRGCFGGPKVHSDLKKKFQALGSH